MATYQIEKGAIIMKRSGDYVVYNMNIPKSLNEKVEYAMKDTGLNKTSVVILALSQYFKQTESIDVMKDAITIINKELKKTKK